MPLTIDTSLAIVISATTVATTTSFTVPANSLIVALVGIDGPTTGAVTATMSDTAGLTWNLAIRQNAFNAAGDGGSSEIWWARSAAGFTSQTVTATNSSTAGAGNQSTDLQIIRFTGHDLGTTIGATAGTDFPVTATTAYTQAITTSRDNSWCWGAAFTWNNVTAMTANGSTAILGQGNNGDGATYANFAQSSTSVQPSAAASSNLTLGGTLALAQHGHIVAVEILEAAATDAPGSGSWPGFPGF